MNVKKKCKNVTSKGAKMITLKINDIPSSNNKYIVFGVIYRGEQ